VIAEATIIGAAALTSERCTGDGVWFLCWVDVPTYHALAAHGADNEVAEEDLGEAETSTGPVDAEDDDPLEFEHEGPDGDEGDYSAG